MDGRRDVYSGEAIVAELEALRADGADADALMRAAVERISGARDAYDWVGIYLLEGGELVLHNYIGEETEHTRIAVGHGVCGTAVAEDRDLNVPDVHALDNYIACSVGTASEVVILIRDPGTGAILGQLDLDSDRPAAFDERDERELRIVADWLGQVLAGA